VATSKPETPNDVSLVNSSTLKRAENSQFSPPKPELVIGLVGPVGTDLHGLAIAIEEKMGAFKYRCTKIRVSDLIKSRCDADLCEKIESGVGSISKTNLLMNAGDYLRSKSDRGDALVPLMVAAIRAARAAFNIASGISQTTHATNACYIIDSLKHPDEISTLRGLYGDGFVLISAFESIDARVSKLQRDIAKSNTSTELDRFKDQALELINIDSKRMGGGIGQNVRDSFPLGDFFIRMSDDYDPAISRFLDILFGNPYLTPFRSEYFMFEASAIALRSADLSRQIGAVIVSSDNEIISSGCNDVPIGGGGTYWPDEQKSLDNRDYKTGQDFKSVKKFDIVKDLLKFLTDNGIYKHFEDANCEDVAKELLDGKFRQGFKELRISNLIEFGRVVHAEMFAIMRAAQRGIAIDKSTIYSTTFPCHMCARHIIAAGIVRVVYIEPYPKSMTSELFPETVIIDQKDFAVDESGRRRDGVASSATTVRFDPYEGIAPKLYGQLFKASDNQKDRQGYTLDWTRAKAVPKTFELPESNLQVERSMVMGIESLPKVGLEACTRQ
jgi:deoxycytidylate deaminase